GRSGRPGGDRGTRDGARGPGLPPAGGEAEPPGGPNPPPRPRPAVAQPLARRPPGVVGSGAGGPVCAPLCGPKPDDQPVPYGPDEVDGQGVGGLLQADGPVVGHRPEDGRVQLGEVAPDGVAVQLVGGRL